MALDLPATFSGEALQKARKAVIDGVEIQADTARVGQFDDFNNPEGGAPKSSPPSEAETFCRFDFKVNTERWNGVLFRLVNGKGVSETRFGMDIHFRELPEALARKIGVEPGQPAVLAITVNHDPKMDITLKNSGRVVSLPLNPNIGNEPPHALLIPDSLKGERGLFVSPEEALQAWRVTDSLFEALKGKPRLTYKAGADADSIQ